MCIRVEISEQQIPVLSAVAMRAMELIQQENITNQRLEEVIRQDPGLTSRLLSIANSPFYSAKMQARSISDAVRRLGLRQLRNVVVAAAAGELFGADDPLQQRMWNHALLTAQVAQLLADWLKIPHGEEAYVAGLLHDIGMVIIYQQHPGPYAELIERARLEGRALIEVEQAELQFFTHCTIGGLVARKWHLSDTVAESARFHHDLLGAVQPGLSNTPVACTVALANVVAQQLTDAELAEGDPALPSGELAFELSNYACAEPLHLPAGQSAVFINMARERFCKPDAA